MKALIVLAMMVVAQEGMAQGCRVSGSMVDCGGGKMGTLMGDSVYWTDGTQTRLGRRAPAVDEGYTVRQKDGSWSYTQGGITNFTM